MQLSCEQIIRHTVRVDMALARMLVDGRADGETWEQYDERRGRLADLQHKLFWAGVDAYDAEKTDC